ncbi:MAG: DNA topoisomerase IV subunit A, partial [Candidatus Bathyarchaeia archaeon]
LIRRLNQELDLPVYIFTDGDPWGMHIAMVIISGSANAAHLRELTTPDAKWAGVWATDIEKYKLPSDKLTDLDIKRLNELKADPRYEGKLWKREIETFLRIKKKAEQEAFSRYGLTYIVDEYLPAKLELMEEY